MVAKLIFILGLIIVVAHGGLVPAPYAVAPAVPVVKASTDYDPHPQYSFAYDVQDALTGDSKAQYETRDGDVVRGSYSLIEADGTRRRVEYTADPINGFNAVVHREPAIVNAVPVPARPAPVTVVPGPTLARTSPVFGSAPGFHF